MATTLQTIDLENALRAVRSSQRSLGEQFGYDATTNEYGAVLPAWAAEVRDGLHTAHEAIINAIDPTSDRVHGWWESL